MRRARVPATTKDSVPMARDVRRPLAAEPGLPGSTFEWVEALRGAAIERFRKNGFPTPKVEAWKFTKLGPLERIAFRSDTGQAGPIVTKAALAPYRLTPECHLAVFVNGRSVSSRPPAHGHGGRRPRLGGRRRSAGSPGAAGGSDGGAGASAL